MREGEIEIRTLGPDDAISEITQLLHVAYRPLAERGMRYLASHQDDEKTRERAAKGECALAWCGGSLVGTVTLADAAKTTGSPWYDRPEVASFGQFAVRPELQGSGIGSRLVDWVEARAREKGVRELALDTSEHAKHLLRFYERRGYRFIEHVRWSVTNYRSVILSKPLSHQPDQRLEKLR